MELTIDQKLYVEWAVGRALRRRLARKEGPETLYEAAQRMREDRSPEIRQIAELVLDESRPPWTRLAEAAAIARPLLLGL